jgi:hypothetical protein
MNFRAITAIVLFVSFIAMATSGLLMLVIDRPSFSIRMHPVHKLFGLLLILGVLGHLSLNYRVLLAHVRQRAAAAVGTALALLLVLLYAVAALMEIDAEQAAIIDKAAVRLEQGPAQELGPSRAVPKP